MTTVAYFDRNAELPDALPWPMRIAAARGGGLALFVTWPESGHRGATAVDLAGGSEGDSAAVIAQLRTALDRVLGPERWTPAVEPETAEQESDAVPTEDQRLQVSLRLLPGDMAAADLLTKVAECKPSTLVVVQGKIDDEDEASGDNRRHLVGNVGCELIWMRPGSRLDAEGAEILAAVGEGPHTPAALKLAVALGEVAQRPVAAIYVERDIGPDSEGVGYRALDRIAKRALGDDRNKLSPRVIIDKNPHRGILVYCERQPPGLVVLGSSEIGGLGERIRNSVPQKLVRGSKEDTVAIVRAAVPLAGRTLRRLETLAQLIVPQLQRDSRLELVERIQSNSRWDFDFVTLMSLSTAIAALGLVDNSPAVVIGAMLVAPLMTPLLGSGLALVQGNPVLGRMAARSVALGFVTAFVIGLVIGLTALRTVTPEMAARDWPGVLDLVVAFVSGIAAAYASSRPGLMAALPGVAIAAALVPPIATSGLAVAVGDWDLTLGSALLFLTNMVAIVAGAALSLWAVGARFRKGASHYTRVTSWALMASMLVLGVVLSVMRHRYAPPSGASQSFAEAVERALPDGYRVRELRVDHHVDPALVVVTLGGPQRPDRSLATSLHALAQEYVDEGARLRVEGIWELRVR